MKAKTLIREVAERTGYPREIIQEIINETTGVIAQRLMSGDTVSIPNIGSISLRSMIRAEDNEDTED